MCKGKAQQEKKLKIPVCLKLTIKVQNSGVRRLMKHELLKNFFYEKGNKTKICDALTL